MDWREHIITDKSILLGKPCIKGTRLSIEFILQRLADGWSIQDIINNYPRLTLNDLKAVFLYLNDCMKDGLLFDNTSQKAAS
jgi:uncharacterized protein (DUF433 family)